MAVTHMYAGNERYEAFGDLRVFGAAKEQLVDEEVVPLGQQAEDPEVERLRIRHALGTQVGAMVTPKDVRVEFPQIPSGQSE